MKIKCLARNFAISTIFLSLFLTGCVEYEAHGHYKFDEKRLSEKEKMSKNDVASLYGAPLLITNNEDVWYYMYSHIKKTSFGIYTQPEHRIMRLEFKNNILVKSEILYYTDYKPNKDKDPEPEMKMSILSEIAMGGMEFTNQEVAKEGKEKYRK